MNGLELQGLLPQILLALGATAVLMFGAWYPSHRWILVGVGISVAAALCAALITPAVPEVAHLYSTGSYARFFVVVWAILGALTLLLSLRYTEIHDLPGSEYTSLVLFAICGMGLLSSASSLLGLFLGLEAFTLVLYILIAFKREDPRGAEAGLKYLVMGAVATAFMAFGIALIYAASGSFHLPEVFAGLQQQAGGMRALGLVGWAMMLVAIGFKVSLAPFHLWTPDVYQGAPAPVTGLLATGSKGAVFAALIPLFAALGPLKADLNLILWVLAALSMLAGTLAALPQRNLKRMLAYSSVVHMGYLMIGLLVGDAAAQRALVFYIIAYTIATLGAFGVLTSFSRVDDEPQDYADFRGLGYLHPRRSSVLAACLLSLAGIPPLVGFFAKFGIITAALRGGYPGLAVIAIIAALVSLYYYLAPIIVLFMQERDASELRRGCRQEYIVLALCFAGLLLLGVYPAPLLELLGMILP
ncbi:NADH-quinone oxidoreductase subunit N [Geopsychrobacter electrodiphilus]|uniref:NADH-quinone oxidoreductase subunit N n=1 Tax=Geopsychrobacter electrodiphilus TaxID=225196 RepID=UPI0003698C5A|nr:NADH-quinone oxidoreductase subunit N [Geopsychrobacter electrodiphilus]